MNCASVSETAVRVGVGSQSLTVAQPKPMRAASAEITEATCRSRMVEGLLGCSTAGAMAASMGGASKAISVALVSLPTAAQPLATT